jgi:hypothetical protein
MYVTRPRSVGWTTFHFDILRCPYSVQLILYAVPGKQARVRPHIRDCLVRRAGAGGKMKGSSSLVFTRCGPSWSRSTTPNKRIDVSNSSLKTAHVHVNNSFGATVLGSSLEDLL